MHDSLSPQRHSVHTQKLKSAPTLTWKERFDAVSTQYRALICTLLQLPPEGDLPEAKNSESSYLTRPTLFVPFLKTRIPSCDAERPIHIEVDRVIHCFRKNLLIMLRSTHHYFGRQASLLEADLTERGKPTRLTLYAEGDAYGDVQNAGHESKGSGLQRISDALTVIGIAADARLRGERVLDPQFVPENNALLSPDNPYCAGWLQSVFALPRRKSR